jgi:hypothetical protein
MWHFIRQNFAQKKRPMPAVMKTTTPENVQDSSTTSALPASKRALER